LAIVVLVVTAAVTVLAPEARALSADVHAHRARDAASAGNWQRSVAEYREALHLSPSQDRYLKDLSSSLAALALSDGGLVDERFALAEEALNGAIDQSPLDVSYRLTLGTLYYQWGISGQPEMLSLAMEAYGQAAAMSPADPEVWSRWGRVYHAQGQYEAAIEKYEQALALDPLHVQTYSYLAETYLAMRRIKEARETYDTIDQVTAELDRLVSKR
jgi:tetratricopeptide (TPR) repeat protein